MKAKVRLIDIGITVLVFGLFFINILGGIKFGLIFLFLSFVIFFITISENRNRIKVNLVSKIYLLLTSLFILSSVYAVNPVYCIDVLIPVASTNFTMLALINYLTSKVRILRFVDMFLWVALLFAIINAVMSTSGARELYYGGVNTVSFAMFVSVCLAVWRASMGRKFVYCFIPVFLYVVFLSASQKTILSLILVSLFFLALLVYKGKIKSLIPIAILLTITTIAAYYFLSNNQTLNYAFLRTSGTITTLVTGERASFAAGGSDGDGFRFLLIQKGIEFFLDSPIWGHGINNFRPLLRNSIGIETYSHNTPVELGVGIGFLGIIIYYSIFFLTTRSLFRSYKETGNPISLFLISCLLGIIIIGQFMQLYFDAFAHVFIIFVLCYVKIFNKRSLTVKRPNRVLKLK